MTSSLLVITILSLSSFVIPSTSTSSPSPSPSLTSKGENSTSIVPTQTGCFLRPWVCRDRPFFLRPILCCRDVCVDVRSDDNNCGFCRVQCPPMWGCCNAQCRNFIINPMHCGRCFNVCPLGQLCIFGACVQLTAASNTTVAVSSSTAVDRGA